ncbi:capsule polysaccharide biosynthesis protein [Acidisphaera rubrifaciens HS-AP3]|uniref:Capsule polysaccharide biosynthesis protein n=1 Tax=Acidisphaera rubrifaciens HS-AP3 TaxID=1231350 RepID=A0A0D6P7U9_9PROT|nr:capsule polysaccharide biosynthesis protein [Acidisphaera rubrifaciens HS-AP3]
MYELLQKYGYVAVELAGLSLETQIAMFRNAQSVVAPHGGGLTNLVYATRGAQVLELFTEGWLNPCYNVIAKSVQMDYWADVSPATPEAGGLQAHMIVDIDRCTELLEEMHARQRSQERFELIESGPPLI